MRIPETRKILQIGVHDLETLIEYINAGAFNDETLKQISLMLRFVTEPKRKSWSGLSESISPG